MRPFSSILFTEACGGICADTDTGISWRGVAGRAAGKRWRRRRRRRKVGHVPEGKKNNKVS